MYVAERVPLIVFLSVLVYLIVTGLSWYVGHRGGVYLWHGFFADQVQAVGLALGVFGAGIGLVSLHAGVIARSN